MQKKTRTEAGIIGTVSTDDNTALHPAKPLPKKHRARLFMLRSGKAGFTENDILFYCRLSSGRNYASEIERRLNIRLERINEQNPDGIGSHYRYRIANRSDAQRIIDLVNVQAKREGRQQISPHEISRILNLYPDTIAAA
ncbi:hypothetical protein MF265_22375 [Serratia marcescens]|uniref:hypothetical protein n=1 Tax=Serratia marcescens TaxID=615 RepID=UPI001EF05CE6|nr:hypothetical protein [Serratia marcescens]ULH10632.1 hypothetical protein MF265_22375 [Serratia marcescens]